jgi:hypothetical protein
MRAALFSYLWYNVLGRKEQYMLEVLRRVEEALPSLISLLVTEQGFGGWHSLAVRYHKPYVDRLWRPFEDRYRIYLHRIEDCEPGEALFHPHPWPSAMRVVLGQYEMAVGYGKGDTPPPIASTLILPEGAAYEMTDPDSWHYVRPVFGPAYSVMVTGEPWDRKAPGTGEKHRPLNESEFSLLYKVFSTKFK